MKFISSSLQSLVAHLVRIFLKFIIFFIAAINCTISFTTIDKNDEMFVFSLRFKIQNLSCFNKEFSNIKSMEIE